MTTTISRAQRAASLRRDRSEPPFDRILIANRGEIALRIIRTCRDLGVETVAVYSDADIDAAHVRAADRAVRLGPPPASESYLRADAIIDAARSNDAAAIHPGYGFLSERASFARAVRDAGIAFIGPSPESIAALGDKLAARRTARDHDVPVVPGTFDAAAIERPDAIDAIAADADRIGYPLMVKAAAGGGGRGMRRVAGPADLAAALVAGSAEAASVFGDGSVYLEREIRPARHIEVQLLGDQHGTIVALGERDCSVQRRHQKLVEESPAPGLTPDDRRALHGLAIRAARAAGLFGAATAEFLFDTDRRFWFLEINARLQVEHGVTELVCDLDLVAEQLWIAAGAPLPPRVADAANRAIDPTRHALEIRLSAEDPARAFVPTPGRVGRWSMPSGPGVRVDTAIGGDERIPPDYDPMIAKIMTVGDDRASAIDRMRRALDEVEVSGVQTTLPFDRALFRHPLFLAGELSIDFVAEHWDPTPDRTRALDTARRIAAAAVADGSPGGIPSLRKDASMEAGSAWRAEARRVSIDRWPR